MDKIINNISLFSDCYGCGVCATICPKQIITIHQNKSGFYEPHIKNNDECTHCGLCVNVCSYADEKLAQSNDVLKSYVAWSKEQVVRNRCSSGGVGFEIGKALIEQGYKICGVRYNPDVNRAEHYIATTKEDLIQSTGSKYIQSYTVEGFRSINRKEKNLVVGTPCQIDSFRRYIRKYHVEENFVLMDFFCHGVPSKRMWDKYLLDVEKTTGKAVYVSWRNKTTGWHDSYAMTINGESLGKRKTFLNSRYSQGDAFYQLFLSDNCLGKACYDRCKFKYRASSADIRIGDLWGQKYRENEDGITGVVVFTEKGKAVLMQTNCEFVEEPFDIVAEGQMKVPAKRGKLYNRLMPLIEADSSSIQEIHAIVKQHRKLQQTKDRMRHPLRTMRNALKKIFKKR